MVSKVSRMVIELMILTVLGIPGIFEPPESSLLELCLAFQHFCKKFEIYKACYCSNFTEIRLCSGTTVDCSGQVFLWLDSYGGGSLELELCHWVVDAV